LGVIHPIENTSALTSPKKMMSFVIACDKSKEIVTFRNQYAWCVTTSCCQSKERFLMKNTLFAVARPVSPWSVDEALIAMDGNPELLTKVAGLLLKQLDADLPLIRRYAQAKETVPLKDRSHRHKGSLSAIAAAPAFDACAALNDLAVEAQTQCYADGLERLEFEVSRLLPYLNQPISKQKV
jgi:HPt (histidine-containing phosphotransfer) domain-containing protein